MALPTAREEEWRRTDIRALKLASFEPSIGGSIGRGSRP